MDIETFLAHAVQLEREAARRYEELAAAMGTEGNRELQEFFARMAHFSRKHLAEAAARSGFRTIPEIAPHQFQWPDGVAPETAGWAGVDAQMGAREALLLALDGERSGLAYYAAVAATAVDSELRALTAEFAAEEAEHVRELESLIARCPA
jgi:rubrerythrin